MKAAAEGRRKREEAKKQNERLVISITYNKSIILIFISLFLSFYSFVLRSQSCHFSKNDQGIMLSNSPSNYDVTSLRNPYKDANSHMHNKWVLTSTESSDVEDDLYTNTS